MKFIKPIIGCILIVTALVGLFYWEHDGRIRWTTEEVASAAFDIAEGKEINEAMFKKMRVPPECIVDGALSMEEASKLKGRICRQNIKANSQIVADFFENTEELIEEGKSIFVIKPSWMDMRSSSLRSGDIVQIYSDTGDVYLGTFRVAFVKDDNEQEVTSADGISRQQNILDRKMSSRAANHIEIVATLDEYNAINAFVRDGARSLMIVQKGEF